MHWSTYFGKEGDYDGLILFSQNNSFILCIASAIYLSGDGNLELSVKEFERILKPGGVLISVSGVVPEELRREIFADWNWIRDGSADLQAGCFLLSLPVRVLAE